MIWQTVMVTISFVRPTKIGGSDLDGRVDFGFLLS